MTAIVLECCAESPKALIACIPISGVETCPESRISHPRGLFFVYLTLE